MQVWIYSAHYATSADIHVMLTTYANSLTRGPGSRDKMGTFGKGNSGSKYRVDEVCDAHANSADHNQPNAAYCYRRRSVVHVLCVRNGDNHCENG